MQMDNLVNAYLSFQANSTYDGLANQTTIVEPTDGTPSITIEVIDLFCMLPVIYC